MKRRKQFASCLRNKGAEDLEPRKVKVVSPRPRDQGGYLRIIDESRENYFHPAAFFVRIEVSWRAATFC